MMFRLFVIAVACGLLGAPLEAAEDPPGGAPARFADVQNVVLLGKERPVFLRLHIRVGETSFAQLWSDAVAQLFADLQKQADEGAARGELVRIIADDLPNGSNNDVATLVQRLADGRLSAVEFAEALRRLGRGPFSIVTLATPAAGNGRAGPLDEAQALFRALDGNRDTRLDRDELTAAAERLHKLDIDDDELVIPEELEPLRGIFGFAQPQFNSPSQPAQRMLDLQAPGSPAQRVQRFLREYDRKVSEDRPTPDQKLTREELGYEPAAFARFDADGDGLLDFDEIAHWLRNPPPDLEVTLQLGDGQKVRPSVALVHVAEDLRKGLRARPDAVCLVVGSIQFELSVDASGQRNMKQILLANFKASDSDNNNYLELKEVKNNYNLSRGFSEMDVDSDGKLFEAEAIAFVTNREAAARRRVDLTLTDQGRNLFEILDADRDGRLGRGELKSVVERLSDWDADADGALVDTEVPGHLRLRLGRGQPSIPGFSEIFVQAAASPNAQRPPMGPLWFQKMDRNRDGLVSQREFLNTPAQFGTLDTNADGAIDVHEATVAK